MIDRVILKFKNPPELIEDGYGGYYQCGDKTIPASWFEPPDAENRTITSKEFVRVEYRCGYIQFRTMEDASFGVDGKDPLEQVTLVFR